MSALPVGFEFVPVEVNYLLANRFERLSDNCFTSYLALRSLFTRTSKQAEFIVEQVQRDCGPQILKYSSQRRGWATDYVN